jgi:hypothetical protein
MALGAALLWPVIAGCGSGTGSADQPEPGAASVTSSSATRTSMPTSGAPNTNANSPQGSDPSGDVKQIGPSRVTTVEREAFGSADIVAAHASRTAESLTLDVEVRSRVRLPTMVSFAFARQHAARGSVAVAAVIRRHSRGVLMTTEALGAQPATASITVASHGVRVRLPRRVLPHEMLSGHWWWRAQISGGIGHRIFADRSSRRPL